MEIGLYTFADITPDPTSGRTLTPAERYAEVIAAATLADEAGLDVFGIGEHHRLDVPLSSPAVVLAAIAARTKRIHLTSAVTILSTLDPVRVYQDFATVDLLSGGRAEIIAGRGAFTESFPLFGHEMTDYDALFTEKLPLLLAIDAGERVTWEGRFRPPLRDAPVAPRAVGKLPIWIGAGGTPESAKRAGDLGLPLILANIFQPPAKFVDQIADYRRRHPTGGRTAIATHGYVAKDSQAARDEFHPRYSAYFREHVPRNYEAKDTPRDVFDQRASPSGPIFVGSPQEIVDKLSMEHELFGIERCILQIDVGGLPYANVARAIELLASDVLPKVRAIAGSSTNA
jgi:alkanesulfonate monooxygenase SsuD/methylene tetrahydromethanopterin reductase-like flavin-dependent oxidoreductase (luciferase family)